MRVVCAATLAFIIFAFSSCSSAASAPTPITDGVECTVVVQKEEKEQTLYVSRKGAEYVARFVEGGSYSGLTVDVSPGGCFISFEGMSSQIAPQLIYDSLPMLIYTAFTHDYSADSYKNGCYFSNDKCGSFCVWVDDDGVISCIEFSKFNYRLTFDYKNIANT